MSNHHLASLISRQLDGRALLHLVRGPVPASDLHQEIRQALALHVLNSRTAHGSWQEAWNDLAGATPGRAGQLRITPHRCMECHGRRFTLDRRRGAYRPCPECMGRGNGKPVVFTALYAVVPGVEPPHQRGVHQFPAVEPGQRIRLLACTDEYTHLEPGSLGTVSHVDDAGTVHVKWDSGSTLGLVPGGDTFEITDQTTEDSHG